MEDRYTAGNNLRGEHKLVRKKFIIFSFKNKILEVGTMLLGSGVVESLKLSIWV